MNRRFIKKGILLTALCTFGFITVLPYILHMQKDTLAQIPLPIPLELVLVLQTIQNTVLFGILSFAGIYLAERTGFRMPVIDDFLERRPFQKKYLKESLTPAAIGFSAGVLIVLLDIFIFQALIATTQETSAIQAANPTWWKGLLASFYGAINEEVLARLFLVSLIVFAIQKIMRKNTRSPSDVVVWSAIIFSAVLFGLGHLPITSSFTEITPQIIARAIVLNGMGAVAFGWLYWKRNLESAMVAHFSADIVLHVLLVFLAG